MTEQVRPGDSAADHIADGTDAHDASAISFTPDGSISATDVQAAIVEVRDEAGGGSSPFEYVFTDHAKFSSASGSFLYANDETDYLELPGGGSGIRLNADGGGDINLTTDTELIQIDPVSGKTYIQNTYGIVLPIASSDPAGGNSEAGQVYYNDSSNKVRWYNGSAWADL